MSKKLLTLVQTDISSIRKKYIERCHTIDTVYSQLKQISKKYQLPVTFETRKITSKRLFGRARLIPEELIVRHKRIVILTVINSCEGIILEYRNNIVNVHNTCELEEKVHEILLQYLVDSGMMDTLVRCGKISVDNSKDHDKIMEDLKDRPKDSTIQRESYTLKSQVEQDNKLEKILEETCPD